LNRQLEIEIDALIDRFKAKVIVDFGCGDMPYRTLFESRGLQYFGCDITSSAPITIVPGEHLPLAAGAAGVVTSIQVLEHVWDLDWYLSECRRLLEPGGYLVLSTHGSWLYHPHPTDFRRWTRDGLCREIEEHGFDVERITGLMGPLAWTTQFRLLGYREILRHIPVLRQTVLPLLVILMNLRMEIEDALTPAAIVDTNACTYVVVARKPLAP
jgi:SAM-dependent methyltransferase